MKSAFGIGLVTPYGRAIVQHSRLLKEVPAPILVTTCGNLWYPYCPTAAQEG